MNNLFNFFKTDEQLTTEEKVNIMFDSWKSTLHPLFEGNNFYYIMSKDVNHKQYLGSSIDTEDFKNHQIFKNNWFQSHQFCERGGNGSNNPDTRKDTNFHPYYYNRFNVKIKEQHDNLIIKSLSLASSWHCYNIYSDNKYDNIGFWFDVMYTGTIKDKNGNNFTTFKDRHFYLIKFSKNVYGSEKELYKKADIILFDKYNKIVRYTTEHEIKNILEKKILF